MSHIASVSIPLEPELLYGGCPLVHACTDTHQLGTARVQGLIFPMTIPPIMLMKRWLLLLVAPWLISATDNLMPVSMPLGSNEARATAHMVKSVLEYTRWPQRPEIINLCVVGPARFGEGFPYGSLDNGVPIKRHSLRQLDPVAASDCDALYLGKVEHERARQWIALARGSSVVTIAENDPQCISEAIICLIYGNNALSFQLNMDAVARSKVRIDPRIFRMSRGF